MEKVIKPWHDCPRCACGGPMVTYSLRDPAMRLRCCACGVESVGEDDDVEQAKAADAAWEAEHQRITGGTK